MVSYREKRLRTFLRFALPRVAFYAGKRASTLSDLPIVDKATIMADFAAFNVANIDVAEARTAFESGSRARGFVVGRSTGTSGNRGYYVIDEIERMTWLGVILAKALPRHAWWKPLRVALVLPTFGELYGSIARTQRFALRFFDLNRGVDAWHRELVAFAPDVLVAPPKALRILAERGQMHPRHVFSGAEVLDPIDRVIVEAGLGATVREIYMATEGLLGVACEFGTLHLAEDIVAFEFEASSKPGLVIPIITDFSRRSQIVARYRMNDLIRLRDTPCPCGSAYLAVAAVEGRTDDTFAFERGDGSRAYVTPDVIRNAVVGAHESIDDFRVVQESATLVVASINADAAAGAEAAVTRELHHLFAQHGADAAIDVRRGVDVPFDRKLRRVKRA